MRVPSLVLLLFFFFFLLSVEKLSLEFPLSHEEFVYLLFPSDVSFSLFLPRIVSEGRRGGEE